MVLPAQLSDLADHFPPAQEQLSLHAAHDVLPGGEGLHQLEVLVDHADTLVHGVLGGPDGDGLAVHADLTGVRRVQAGENVHQGAFAGAVFTENGMDLTGEHTQIHPVVCFYGSKMFFDLSQFHNGLFHVALLSSLFSGYAPKERFPNPGGKRSFG